MGFGYAVTLIIAMAIAFAALIGAAMLARRQQRRMRSRSGNGDVVAAIRELSGELRRSNDLLEETVRQHEARLRRLEEKTGEGGETPGH